MKDSIMQKKPTLTDSENFFDQELIESIFKICSKIVYDSFSTNQNSIEIAEELASETLIRLWKNRGKIDFLTGKIWGYIKKIASNIFLDIQKRGKVNGKKVVRYRPHDELPEVQYLPNIDYDDLIEEIMNSLKDPIDQLIVKKKIEGYKTAEEIVPFLATFGINDPSAVSKRLNKIKTAITKLVFEGEQK